MPKWTIEGFRGCDPTDLSRQVTGSEDKVKLLLQRLAARHLTDDEIIDATLGKRLDFDIHRDKRVGKPLMLNTSGTDYHYLARIETLNAKRP